MRSPTWAKPLMWAASTAEQIAFVHDHPKPEDKAALYKACRAGRISVLMGSTEKMGTGTNVTRETMDALPSASRTRAATVGLPRESRISRAPMPSMVATELSDTRG